MEMEEKETPASRRSNLEKFLESTIPSVPAHYLSKTTMRELKACDVVALQQPYFVLGDLWESYKEWSVYGAGVPIVLNGGCKAVQFYVPYLSGIQLYGESKRKIAKTRRANKDFNCNCHRNSTSDRCSNDEVDNSLTLSREGNCGIASLSLRDNLSAAQEDSSSDECGAGNSQDHLLFEFLDCGPPHTREPLLEKILNLSHRYPQLKTLRSCDLLPNSWVSVAWYPIYKIPAGPAIRDLEASFLTYHSLSTPMGVNESAKEKVVVIPRDINGVPMISLSAFGMAAYKFRGPIWVQNGVNELQRLSSLMVAAENWLTMLEVNHPDFQFFASHAKYSR